MAALARVPGQPVPFNFATMQPPKPVVPQTVAPFTGTAPTAQPIGTFAPPAPGGLSPFGQFRFAQGTKAIERGAAAKGTILTGGLQTRLAEFGQGLASEEADKDYQRTLDTYRTNRDTALANVGQERDAYRDLLTGYTTNRDTAAQNFAQDRAVFHDALDVAPPTAAPMSAPAPMQQPPPEQPRDWGAPAAYQQQMMDYARRQDEERRAQQAAMALQQQQQAESERARQEMERARLENEAIQRAATARQNASANAIPFAPVAKPFYPQGATTRRAR